MLVEDRGKNPSCRLLPRKLTLALTSASLGALTQGYTFVLLGFILPSGKEQRLWQI